ncbi:hypothetical protein HPP92_008001 [Vanilla planifolia]|uniref:Uncharacterized protein n=1 Tax=Vanilla planifolia TaxID=51239 RepID=A0A835V9Y1_VANPL|nr:hypothetical protein HPP92_008001 [Vanilla planifolia]
MPFLCNYDNIYRSTLFVSSRAWNARELHQATLPQRESIKYHHLHEPKDFAVPPKQPSSSSSSPSFLC